MYGTVEFCISRGFHVRNGVGHGTNEEAILWSTSCADCGTRLDFRQNYV
jgi:hypothetical protein